MYVYIYILCVIRFPMEKTGDVQWYSVQAPTEKPSHSSNSSRITTFLSDVDLGDITLSDGRGWKARDRMI